MRRGGDRGLFACARRAAVEWGQQFYADPQWHAHALGGIACALRQIDRSADQDRGAIAPEHMNEWVDGPPPKRGMGCFARGCLILVVFAIVLAIACLAGLYLGFQRNSAIALGGYWLAKTHSLANAPVPVPEFAASDEQIQAVQQRWRDFEHKTRAVQPAEIELTADDLNSSIAANRYLRGKIYVSIDGNRLRLQASIPLAEYVGRSGYYFNGDIAIQSDAVASLANPRIESITINGQPLPRDILDWTYGSRRLREYLAEYRNDYDVGTIEIRDGKLIVRSGTH